ncbi:MAG TPA: outer membrane protein assembly factor BamA, partial [Candidatus Deferrimicrobium sp.]
VEKPIVITVQIEGNKDVDTADLRAAVTVKERSLFQEEKVKESVNKLREVAQNKGFIDAFVEASVAEDSEGALRVTFRVAEGKKLKIERIVVTGNQFFPKKAVLKAMDTSAKGLFSFLTDSGAFKKDVIENDVRKIEALYQNSGFLDSKIFEPVVSRGKKGLIVTIRIYEGRQYRVGEIHFSGESGIPEGTLRKTVKLRRGELFDRETLLSDLLALTTLVNDEGYAQALVSPGVEKRKEYPIADVTYRFERGTKFHFGKVEISGNTKTLDRVIRHNLDVSDGRTYTATGLKTSKEDLTRTSYFKDVKISTAPSAVPGEMDAKIEVQEGPTGTLSGGLGYSTLDKIFGVVQLTENNLFGRGWRASLNSQFGARRTTYSLDFRDPYFLDSDFSLLLGAYKTKVKYTDFEMDARGGRVGLGYNFTKFTTGSVSFRMDETKILALAGTVPAWNVRQEIDKGLQQTRSVGFNVTRNTT